MGYFRVWDDEKQDWVIFNNHFVDSGKQFTLDFLFNSTNWLSGSTYIGNRYVGVGRSTNTNAGVAGPTEDESVPVGGSWDGVSDADWKLTDEVTGLTQKTRPTMTCIRAGNTCNLEAILTDDNVDYGTGTYVDLYEIAIFLGSGQLKPEADPTDVGATATEKRDAMLIRAVKYIQQGTGYFAVAVRKNQGKNKPIQYVFSDFEG